MAMEVCQELVPSTSLLRERVGSALSQQQQQQQAVSFPSVEVEMRRQLRLAAAILAATAAAVVMIMPVRRPVVSASRVAPAVALARR